MPLPVRLSPHLSGIIDRLKALEKPTAEQLAEALDVPITFDDVRAFVRFDGDNYVRTKIYNDGQVELRLLSWRPGQSTSLHGHGDSACAFRVIRGAATETVLGERDRIWPPGSVVLEDRPRVHQVLNAENDALLTLHAYCPPLPIDAPSSPKGHQIVIVGGGFSGVAVAYHLLKEGGPHLRVHIVESGPWLGRGVAYGVESELFQLNVPASKMSIDPATPDDFVQFAQAESDPHAFLSRAMYGRYVSTRFHQALRDSSAKLRVWRDEATAVTHADVVLRTGRRLPANAVVIATGLASHMTRAEWVPGVVDAWDECALATLPRSGNLLLVGAGLSALDVLTFLEKQNFDGHVTIVSRHGLLPLPHEDTFHGATPLSAAEVEAAPRRLRELVRWVRDRIDSARDVPWQRAVDALRPHAATLYSSLSMDDRARFVRHARPYWDIVRHRAPPDALARVQRLQESGRLRRIAGRARVKGGVGPQVLVDIVQRSGTHSTERFDAVVRCIGPVLHVAEGETPLLRSLLDGGLGRLTSHGLGIECTADGRIVDTHGHPSARIWGIGAVRRASHWETTAVPDIAAHARNLARQLIEG
jgi:uncharacterized NAD(P)/FAD-binding protein YdhS/quercetin dioxygenase-like cupin family protein